uniref:Uncharacterized protein n=1 Tax=Anguilla anguilla TaxID=7936 RepID=A0A0E9VHD2_ANGAN
MWLARTLYSRSSLGKTPISHYPCVHTFIIYCRIFPTGTE